MKIFLQTIFIALLANFSFANEEAETVLAENEFENGCSNELDDDMDGQIDSEDSDCDDGIIFSLSDFEAGDAKPYLWGIKYNFITE